jgi:hypothetical protein
MCVQNELSDEELRAANPIMALLRTLLPWVNVANSGSEDQRESSQEALAQLPGLAEFLRTHGIDPHGPLSNDDRERLIGLVLQYMRQ